jgi:nicotinate-nucleotide pyrophosphorylase (carboxylating)
MVQHLDRHDLRNLWERALQEDGADNDITSLVATSDRQIVSASVVAREAGTFAGQAVFDVIQEAYPGQLTVSLSVCDGEAFKPDTELALLSGPFRTLLGTERTLLNFLQRLCGVATVTRRYVDAVADTGAKIVDTRKTIPGWRNLDKYAVRCGGGKNHRMGVHDAVLVKDNHLAGVEPDRLAGAAATIISDLSGTTPPPKFIEFEVDDLAQLEQLIKVVGIDIILLDNFSLKDMRTAVRMRDEAGLGGRLQLEASGGVDLESVRAIAETGVERIAIGALTHSARALDIALDVRPD